MRAALKTAIVTVAWRGWLRGWLPLQAGDWLIRVLRLRAE